MIDLTHTKVEDLIMTVQTPYKYDVVGSFLRPEKLKQARKDFEAKKITKDELTNIEDACITDLIQKEKAACGLLFLLPPRPGKRTAPIRRGFAATPGPGEQGRGRQGHTGLPLPCPPVSLGRSGGRTGPCPAPLFIPAGAGPLPPRRRWPGSRRSGPAPAPP